MQASEISAHEALVMFVKKVGVEVLCMLEELIIFELPDKVLIQIAILFADLLELEKEALRFAIFLHHQVVDAILVDYCCLVAVDLFEDLLGKFQAEVILQR